MSATIVDINANKPPVRYTVHVDHHYDGQLVFTVEGLTEDQRSKESLADALLRMAATLEGTADKPPLTDEQVAELFHRTYEELAPSFGYETRKESRKPWEEVPEANRLLMTAVAGRVRRMF